MPGRALSTDQSVGSSLCIAAQFLDERDVVGATLSLYDLLQKLQKRYHILIIRLDTYMMLYRQAVIIYIYIPFSCDVVIGFGKTRRNGGFLLKIGNVPGS